MISYRDTHDMFYQDEISDQVYEGVKKYFKTTGQMPTIPLIVGNLREEGLSFQITSRSSTL